MNQNQAPLYEALVEHIKNNPTSFHVPGHKNGHVFDEAAQNFRQILPYDLTELPDLDDLHQPDGVIKRAEQLAADLYQTDYTFFLVNGTTVGNLAMILSVCGPGDQIIVQRNSHKSIFNALELAGGKPIVVAPSYDNRTQRYSHLESAYIEQAIEEYPEAKAIVLSYPDYFGTTYDITSIMEVAHRHQVPVLVDEAHGAHFPLSHQFPMSAIEAGADIVVHSAHKTLPAMTMGSFLHIKNRHVSYETVKYFLQVLQSSSPSYPIMASLDLARKFAAHLNEEKVQAIIKDIDKMRVALNDVPSINVIPVKEGIDDPLKITITSDVMDITQLEAALHRLYVYPEMVQNNQLLLVAGLQPQANSMDWIQLKDLEFNLKEPIKHGTIMEQPNVQAFDKSYVELRDLKSKWVSWDKALGEISAHPVIPYPPGIPVLLKGELIQPYHVDAIQKTLSKGQYIQYPGDRLFRGIEILTE
ncbi:aminotransferase class I/II-fold pyridoxal phosphate-dependent enzyme [Piscibacillus halophilus]|uniref:aminotransferase class I/II-fold pyridoxal phosphate-dependent enzyme n=1 Tax=Piscibacillus halophilus TaxID=571933 RepID=UPI00158E0C91|nr:aminotransferase class I/II-fold pyridoxal phosphate-dependent enzyme [Piscibacillus halophilus]